MKKLEKERENALFDAASQVNSWMIEHLDYFLIEIITGI